MMKSEKVLIGHYLGTIEEFVPGKGTYAEDGKIYASIVGEAVVDRANHTASVKGRVVPELEVGQTVFGEVVSIRRNNVTVVVKKIMGEDAVLDERTAIYVSNIADGYVEKPEDVFGVGDIVKGKIIKINGNKVDLSTKGGMGVVLAFCKRCRHPLGKNDKFKDKLVCSNCASEEKRQISEDYGNVKNI